MKNVITDAQLEAFKAMAQDELTKGTYFRINENTKRDIRTDARCMASHAASIANAMRDNDWHSFMGAFLNAMNYFDRATALSLGANEAEALRRTRAARNIILYGDVREENKKK